MMNNEGRATSLVARLEHVYLFNFNCCDFVLMGYGADLFFCFFKKRLFIWYLFLF